MSRRHNRWILLEMSLSMSKLRLLLSSDWEWVKLSPRVHLHCESMMAAGQSTAGLYWVGSRHLGRGRREDPEEEFRQNNNWERISYNSAYRDSRWQLERFIMSKHVPSIIKLHVCSNTHSYMPLFPVPIHPSTASFIIIQHNTTLYPWVAL